MYLEIPNIKSGISFKNPELFLLFQIDFQCINTAAGHCAYKEWVTLRYACMHYMNIIIAN